MKREDMNALALGVVEKRKQKENNLVKYKVIYKDYNGKQHSTWTNWMRDDGYQEGDSIPVRNIAIPSFGLINLPVAINNNPQRFVAPYVFGLIATSLSSLFIGYQLGKNRKQ